MKNITEEYQKRLNNIFKKYKEELKSVRVNRPTASLVEDLEVNYYGSKTPLSHLASIQVKPPREIVIQVWDNEAVKSVSDAIKSSDLGLSANADGKTIRIFMPELSKERREELTKHVKKIVEEYRIEIRNARDEINKKIESKEEAGEVSEDDKYRLKKEVQKETDEINKKIKESFAKKKKKIEN
ncbi:MAG TPA: ribosome recycling factor [Candidatus Paceibacterota bacterium]|nr:ribosome recycling factor [Candidatus Paceibacterota bacterium]